MIIDLKIINVRKYYFRNTNYLILEIYPKITKII